MSGIEDISVEETADAAAAWFVRLQGGEATGDDWLAFEGWLRAAPDHAVAYERLENLWVDLEHTDIVRELGPRPAARRAAPRQPARQTRRAWLGVGVALAASLAVAVGVGLWPRPVTPQTFETAPGEIRQIALADGTHIHLNAASKLLVRLERGARKVEMAEGEAVFDVAHDKARPFLIAVSDRQVKVVGTEFNLRHRDGRMALTVRRGLVEVRPADALQTAPTKVAVGQELAHTFGQPGSILRVSDPEAAFAWTGGQLIYRNQPLSEVAADLSRRFATPIRMADAQTAALMFSGVLVTDDEQAVLRRLEAFAPVRAERSGGEIILRRR